MTNRESDGKDENDIFYENSSVVSMETQIAKSESDNSEESYVGSDNDNDSETDEWHNVSL